MGRPKGAKNAPGHGAGGRRPGSGRKRKHTEVGGETDDEGQSSPTLPVSNLPNGSENGQAMQPPAVDNPPPGSPRIRLRDVHPDLLPFLAIPHNIPLVCFFDPNRYPPIAQQMSGTHPPAPPVKGSTPPNSDQAAPTDVTQDEYEEPLESPSASSEGTPNNTMVPSQTDTTASSSTGPYVFNKVVGDPSARKRRRCLICMNAGRINHAFMCPGRGNRSACATAREISRSGGSLPAESSRWNSKNTQTPIFAPVPNSVFPFAPPPHLSMPAHGPSGPVLQPHIGPLQLGPLPLVVGPAPPVKPVAPLGYLPSGAVRIRRPRRCKICVARGEDGTLCTGRAQKQKCPHYVEGAEGTTAAAIAMDRDSDEEEAGQAVASALTDGGPSPPPP